MFRQMIVGVTLLAFVNLLIGCYSTEKVPANEPRRESEKITELVLLDGSSVRFAGEGATFRPGRTVIRGNSPAGEPIIVPTEGKLEFRITPPRSISSQDLGNARIAEMVLSNDILVIFDQEGGRYVPATDKIKGNRPAGNAVAFPLNAVKSIRTESPTAVGPDQLSRLGQESVYEVVGLYGSLTEFDSLGGHIGEEPPLFTGRSESGHFFSIPVDSVLYANVRKPNVAGSILATVGIIVGVLGVAFLIALATKQSCPFIYSFDGKQYVFDAEPLGGAICQGLARTDLSRLDYLKAAQGEYKLLIRNEVPETQILDRMKLLVVDHPPGVKVYPDLKGEFYAFRTTLDAVSAVDENGTSLMNFLRASDDISWQTHLPSASKSPEGPARHTLTITLPKPPGAQRAWLVTNIGTSSWGSNMIRKSVEYRGNTAGPWLESIVPGSQSYAEMYQFIEREEMYHLNVWMKQGESWKQEGIVLGQGPLICEERVYPLDVSNAKGDSLQLRLNPPRGFWTVNYVGVSYEDPHVMTPAIVDARWARDQNGESILDSLNAADRRYYSMPEVGDWAEVGFTAPEQQEGTARALYLQTTGYYTLHLPQGKPDQLARLYDISIHPGRIVKAAMEEFRSWQAEQQTARSLQQQ